MKKILFLILFLPPFHFSSFGIDYFKGNFQAALDSAKKYDKLIFMNIAATWSGVSNRMEKNVFRNQVIDSLIVERFIPLRLEASSQEGTIIQQQFGIAALPAYLVLNKSGNVVRLRIGEVSLDAFHAFLKDAIREPLGYQNLEKETISSFNSTSKTANDYSWATYNFNYLLSKPEMALVFYTSNNFKPKGVASKLEIFHVLCNCARKAGKSNNVALLNEVGIYAEKIGFGKRELSMINLFYFLEKNDVNQIKKRLIELAENKDRFTDFQFTGVIFSEFIRSISEIYYRTADSETLLNTLEQINIQNNNFERVYSNRIYKYYRAILLNKVGHTEEAKAIANEILKTYEFVPADKNYEEVVAELEKIADERE
ncbi:MAG: thioredoxin family protein [Arcicella sp.]|nr:thioredoxin family protein [Arcicella sp.]